MKNWCTLIYATVLLPRLPPDATLRLRGDDTAKPLNPLMASHCQGGSLCSRCTAPLPLLWHWHSSTYCMPILGAKREKNIPPTPPPSPLFFSRTSSQSVIWLLAAEPLGCQCWPGEGVAIPGFPVASWVRGFRPCAHTCTGDDPLNPVNSQCELQGTQCGFISAEFGFLITPDHQIFFLANVSGTIPKECFRFTKRIR